MPYYLNLQNSEEKNAVLKKKAVLKINELVFIKCLAEGEVKNIKHDLYFSIPNVHLPLKKA